MKATSDSPDSARRRLAAIAMGGLVVGAIAGAATARADLKNANGVKVGEASLHDTTEGVKVSATFTDLPSGPHAFHVHAVGRCEPAFRIGGHPFQSRAATARPRQPPGPTRG